MRALVVVLLLALAPQAAAEKVYRVGLLSNGRDTTAWRRELVGILHQHGFAIGRNLEMVERYSDGHFDRLPSLARELDAAGVDAIVALSQESVRAALAATKTTPIVMVVGEDPVAVGIVASRPVPGGRRTAVANQTFEGDAKRLELLTEAIPSGRRFGYLGMSFESVRKVEAITRAADRLGITLTTQLVEGPAQYGTAFAAMRTNGAAGVGIGANPPLPSSPAQAGV